jgi:hypothetical protein
MAHFKLEAEISGLGCSFDAGEELEFRYKSSPPVVVSLKPPDRNYKPRSVSIVNAICTATSVVDIGPELNQELSSCLENGNVKISTLTPATLKAIDHIFSHLRAVSRSTIIMFNWTHGLDGPPDPYGLPYAFYSEDGNIWFQYSQVRRVRLLIGEATHSIFARNAQIDAVVRKVEAGAEEPLARQVFREAWSQIGVNPRSALVIGVSAAEVGLRGLIGTLIPDAKWLVQEIQTPPVGKVLRKFLPTLPVKARWVDGRPITLPLKIVKLVEKAFELRNKVVHSGALPPSREELATMLRAISDFLWICDVYLGEHWAMKHVSLDTKKDWPSKSS